MFKIQKFIIQYTFGIKVNENNSNLIVCWRETKLETVTKQQLLQNFMQNTHSHASLKYGKYKIKSWLQVGNMQLYSTSEREHAKSKM